MNYKEYISPIEEIIKDIKNGKMAILTDDEDRENEGDLVIAAEFADADAINFMAKYGRGLICLPMEKKRINELGLPPMAMHNISRFQTAFTVSIEAIEGVTTGISAADRAKTISVAIDHNCSSRDIATPGHVFPLEAREGGVLVRAGHTEATVDIAKLAGLKPYAVICEIMNDDGTMARLPDLSEFAKKHSLRIGTISDLIAYRRKHDRLVECKSTTDFNSIYGGDFKMHLYVNNIEYAEHIALVKGDISAGETTLIRMHALDVLNDTLGSDKSGKSGELQKSMEIIGNEGKGIIVLIREPNKNTLSQSINKLSANNDEKPSSNLRDYGIGAQILLDLGVQDMTLLTNSDRNIIALDGYGLCVKGYREIK